MEIKVQFDLQGLQGLADTQAKLAQFNQGAPELFRTIAGIMHAAVDENFAQQGRPKWAGLAPIVNKSAAGATATAKKPVFYSVTRRTRRQILRDTGRLANSITTTSSGHSASVGTNLVYAKIHHFGGTTKAHTITPRHGQALKFGNTFAKVVNHPGSKIPARPFLVLAPSDEADIGQAVQHYLRNLLS